MGIHLHGYKENQEETETVKSQRDRAKKTKLFDLTLSLDKTAGHTVCVSSFQVMTCFHRLLFDAMPRLRVAILDAPLCSQTNTNTWVAEKRLHPVYLESSYI